MHTRHRIWWGLLLIVLGLLFLLDNMKLIDFSQVIHNYWPALLILWGLSILLRRSAFGARDAGHSRRADRVFEDVAEQTSSENIQYSNVFGDLGMRVTSQNFKGGTVSTVFGDLSIDMSGAGLADGEQVLKLNAVFGDSEVTLPKNTAVSVNASVTFGDVRVKDQRREGFSPSLKYESEGYAGAPKRLRIDVSQVFGDITVRE